MALLSFGSAYFSTPAATANIAATPIKADGTTTPMQLADFDMSASNRLRYLDATTRTFEVMFTGCVSKGGGGPTQGIAYIYKNDVLVDGSNVERTIANASDFGAFAVSCQVTLALNDYVELWLETDNGDNLTIESGVLSAKVLG